VKLIAVAVVALFSGGIAVGPAAAQPAASPTPPTPPGPTPAPPAAPSLASQLARIDELHHRRDDRAALAEEEQLVQATLARAPRDYGVLWRAARLYFWLSDDPAVSNDQRSRWGREGWDIAERAIAVNPNDVAGTYWAAVCMGNYALGLGVMKALAQGMEGKFKDRLKRAGDLNAGYEHGSIQVAWGRFYDKLPWPKRDRKKAQEFLRAVLQAHPYNLRARVFLANSLADDDQPAEAKRLLDEVLAAPVGRYDPPEERRAKVLATRLMPDVQSKLK
jgi:hypothetical protein